MPKPYTTKTNPSLVAIVSLAAEAAIMAYRKGISPVLGQGKCAIGRAGEQTCSQYGLEVVRKHNPKDALHLIKKRLHQCAQQRALHPEAGSCCGGSSSYSSSDDSDNPLPAQDNERRSIAQEMADKRRVPSEQGKPPATADFLDADKKMKGR